jgi:hypothetical protein
LNFYKVYADEDFTNSISFPHVCKIADNKKLIRKLYNQESTKVTGNNPANDAAKEALNEETHHTERYPAQDLIE